MTGSERLDRFPNDRSFEDRDGRWTSGRTSAPDGSRRRRGRCRSRPSGSTPPARSASASSSWRSSGSASTRPRSGTSASAAAATPCVMGERIATIVAERGKMHNPETDSGGVLLGTVTAVGERLRGSARDRRPDRHAGLADADAAPPRCGDRTSIPSPRRSRSRGRPTSGDRRPGVCCPTTSRPRPRSSSTTSTAPARTPAPSRRPTAGRSASSAPATPASSRSPPPATPWTGGDARRRRRRRRRRRPGRRARPLRRRRRRRPPRPARRRSTRVRGAGVGPADLTVVVVNATGCEPTAILLTAARRDGPLLLDGDAASQTAALTADGQSRRRSR